MLLRLSLDLPRDAATVAMARRALDGALAGVGVEDDCRTDIQLALTEACGNVVVHAVAAADYTVDVTVNDDQCTIEVSDRGDGFVLPRSQMPDSSATSGRGLHIVAALVDHLDVVSTAGTCTRLRFTKRLTWTAPSRPTRPKELD
ncbi:serine/threonine-protein kinase RsbW [Micromonospora sp. M71_S20]|uniref:ATP-binding protein n=1 Tax=Micromonospora sp. M71_S20 TaxID=592872 RepID=UPI000F238A35|nr:ATP-binding protein [Micromonospora sp. M71_S20]RLK24743.1 serine/threonine-protein kinase RsbW [Micromonospora sp. M71_S20]